MKKIMIDMDDVICKGGFLAIVNEFLQTSYKEEDIKTYYIQDIIPKTKYEEWKEFFRNKNIYDYSEMLPDVKEVLKKLNEEYEIYIVTDYVFRDDETKSAEHLKNKFNYLIEKFPFISPKQYVFIANKEIIDCDIRIDDKVKNLEGNAKLKLLFSAYHNRNITDEELTKKGIVRVNSWKEIEDILLKEKK